MNRVVHFEINATDVDRASKFYRVVFGWKIEPWGPPEYGYMHVETGDSLEPGIDGGIWKGQGSMAPAGSRLNAFNFWSYPTLSRIRQVNPMKRETMHHVLFHRLQADVRFG